MTRIKLCGLSRERDIIAANELLPEYIGFVFCPKSKRYISPELAEKLRKILAPQIMAVGVFVDEKPEYAAALAEKGIINLVQLHGNENCEYISRLRTLTAKPVIQAFRGRDIPNAQDSSADYILLDSGLGTGKVLEWSSIKITRPYFLAGGLTPENVGQAIRTLHPFAVDVSSGLETDGNKDRAKIAAFVKAVRAVEKETL